MSPPVSLLGVHINIASLATKAIQAVLKFLFGDLAGALGEKTLNVLLVYPDFTAAGNYGHVQSALEQTLPIVLALLALFTMLGFTHGLATDGQSGGLDAFKRFLFSFVMVWAWTWLFARCVGGANLFLGAMVDLPMVKQSVGQGIELAMLGGSTPIGAIATPVVSVLVLLLLGTKIAATALLGIVFVGGSFALAVFPYPPLSHLTGAAFQTLGAVLAIPFLWTIELLVFAAFGKGALTLDGAGLMETITSPLVAMVLLVIMLLTPGFLLKQGYARGLLPSLQSGMSMAYYGQGMAGAVGGAEIARRAETQMTEAAAPSARMTSAEGPAMGFGGFATSPTDGFGAVTSAGGRAGELGESRGPTATTEAPSIESDASAEARRGSTATAAPSQVRRSESSARAPQEGPSRRDQEGAGSLMPGTSFPGVEPAQAVHASSSGPTTLPALSTDRIAASGGSASVGSTQPGDPRSPAASPKTSPAVPSVADDPPSEGVESLSGGGLTHPNPSPDRDSASGGIAGDLGSPVDPTPGPVSSPVVDEIPRGDLT